MSANSKALSAIAQYDLAFQISPIILYNGIAANAQGKMLPIINFMPGLQSGNRADWPRFMPLAGSTLIAQTIATYPFANQTIAANTVVQQPLTLSMVMIAPVNTPGGYLQKLPMFSGLQYSIQLHNNSQGTYYVATPAFIYGPLVMTSITDITEAGGESPQVQIRWQWEFSQPILTVQAAQQSQNGLMSAITGGAQLPAQPNLQSTSAQAPNPNLSGITAALSLFGDQQFGVVL